MSYIKGNKVLFSPKVDIYTSTGLIEGTITEIYNEKAELIRDNAFITLTNLKTVRLPNVYDIGQYAFSGCYGLEKVEIPEAQGIWIETFSHCQSLEKADFPKAQGVGEAAFQGCTSLITVNMPIAVSVEKNAFKGCTSLMTVNMPIGTYIGDYAFYNCTALQEYENKATSPITISGFAFSVCKALETVDLTACRTIANKVFEGCTALKTLIIRDGGDIATLEGVDAFRGTQIQAGRGYIYVPDPCVEDYKAATNWATYAAQIKSINELPTE